MLSLQEYVISKNYCDALRNLLPFVQFKKREKHPWKNATFSKVSGCNFTTGNTPPWVFFTFFKLYKRYQIAQKNPFGICFVSMSEWSVFP